MLLHPPPGTGATPPCDATRNSVAIRSGGGIRIRTASAP